MTQVSRNRPGRQQPHGRRIPEARFAAVGLALVLALACASPTPRAPGAARDEYLPLVSGARWVYVVESARQSDRLEIIARGLESVHGSSAPLFLLEERMDGEAFGLEDSGWVGYFASEGYWRRYSTIRRELGGGFRLFASGAVRVLPLDPHPGEGWEEVTYLFESPESRGGAQRWTVSIEEGRTLRTPAGKFREVLVVRSDFWDPTLARDEPLMSYEDVYARGVGLIRSRAHNHIDAGADVEQTLISVDFPAAPE